MTLSRNVSAFLGAVFLCIGLVTPVANAQDGGSGLQLSPTRNEISANQGEQKTITLSLKNITTSTLNAGATLNDFESDNVSGTPRILIDNTQRTPYSISSMLQGLKDVELAPGETKEITLTVDVPGNAAPGAYFGAIRYTIVPKVNASESERQIALNASVAHLVFIEVPGDVVAQIRVDSLGIQKGNNKPRKILFGKSDKEPFKAALSIKNLGNGFSRPFGKVTVANGFGKEVHSYEVNASEPRAIVLPDSSRTFTDEIKGVNIPGKYTAVAAVAYGNGGEVVTYKSTFWYLPVWFLALLFVLLIVIVAGIYVIYRKKFSGGKKVKKVKASKK